MLPSAAAVLALPWSVESSWATSSGCAGGGGAGVAGVGCAGAGCAIAGGGALGLGGVALGSGAAAVSPLRAGGAGGSFLLQPANASEVASAIARVGRCWNVMERLSQWLFRVTNKAN